MSGEVVELGAELWGSDGRENEEMSKLEYINIKAYWVTCRLRGKPVLFEDPMAERLPCKSCGAPAGYFCLPEPTSPAPDSFRYLSRFTCKGIIGSQNPRTLLAFAKGAEEIQARAAKK
jgi:hypothetical protein